MIFQRTTSGITVDYSQFIGVHGKQPKGRGYWAFDLGLGKDKILFLNGTLTECIKQVVPTAKAAGVARIIVGA